MAIDKVLVVGLGLMGRGILQVCAQAGFESYGYDVSGDAVQNATGFIEKSLDRRIKKGKLTEEELRGDRTFSIFLIQCSNLSNNIQLKMLTRDAP